MVEWLLAAYVIDPWTLIHLLGWALATVAVRLRTGWSWTTCVILGLAAGVGWELIEPYTVEAWLGFSEPFLNRWVTDVLADLLGAVLGASAANLRSRR